MEFVQHVRKTDLARNTRRVINTAQRGQTVVIESHGQPEVAIIDIVDYRILRAVMRYYAQQPEIDVKAGLSGQDVARVSDSQAHYDLVLAHYLAGAISLARAAELLELSWLDLRTRCLRLDVPLRTAPAGLTEATADVAQANLHPQSQRALALLRAWQAEPDELGDEWWEAFEQDLKQHRFSLREIE